MRKSLVLAALALGLLCQAAQARTIVFATDATWPPLEFVTRTSASRDSPWST